MGTQILPPIRATKSGLEQQQGGGSRLVNTALNRLVEL
jgi:hypothetical protein